MPAAKNYDKKTPREHVLLRPDTYIGDIEKTTDTMYISTLESKKIFLKKITYVPGLYKIYDEILVNARDASRTDSSCNTLKVECDTEKNFIMIQNNGNNGIPIEIHQKFNTYIPQMIFGEMLTSSNYDDTEKRTTGGRNGYGAKLTNIFSTKFEIEVGDNNKKLKYKQTWEKNMEVCKKPKISDYDGNGYVKIKFYPDLEKFGLEKLDEDHFNLFYKRALDIAGTTNKLNVHFNKSKINIKTFKDYINLYGTTDFYYDNSNDRWNIGCYYQTPENILRDGGDIISFVNGISTYNGGTHSQYIVDQLIKPIQAEIKKKDKDLKVNLNTIKENFIFFVDSIIENPAFSSQTKDTLTTKSNKFGSTYKPPDSFIKKILKSGVVQQVLEFAKMKANSQLKKNDGKKQIKLRGIPKLDDANKAGSKDSHKCSLILTEGDSAKAFAMSGLSVVGKDYYGVFPLKGKLLNVREASVKQRLDNQEINYLKQILGLKQDLKYTTENEIKTLRYNKIICLTDQDVDGSHIKGLLINFFHFTWPELLKRPGFITSLATPIVKAFKNKEEKIFYNLTEYEEWQNSNDTKGYKIKYYKGLGTSTSSEAKVYFHDFDEKLIKYFWEKLDNNVDSENSITLAFDKKRADDRKNWLKVYNKTEVLDQATKDISYGNFIHLDMKHFSNDDTSRSIPHILDGFKPSQRKILYGAFLRGLDKTEVKVAQLSGFVSDKAAYHHGEMSLNGTIINMAQDYPGSNNINILKPNGQFGTRLQGGKDAASPRYIWTELPKIISIIFNKKDNNILNNQVEDGLNIEPEYYAPIIPMVLVNGAEGIGTGFSTKIPNFNPVDIINNLLSLLDDGKYKRMKPYWNSFNGTVKKISKLNYEVYGNFEIKKNKVIVTELPIGEWTQTYKNFLEKQLEIESSKKEKKFINFKDNNTDKDVYFELEFNKDFKITKEYFEKNYHMVKKVALTNMHLYSSDGCIKKYNNIKDIIEEYFVIRLELYQKRKDYMLNVLKEDLEFLSFKVKFIRMVIEDELVINKRKKKEIESDLIKHKFPKLGKDKDFSYLLKMNILSLTHEKILELEKQMNDKEVEYKKLDKLSNKDIWKSELTELLEYI